MVKDVKRCFGKGMAIPFPASRGSGGVESVPVKEHA